jgi:hypothetical protein
MKRTEQIDLSGIVNADVLYWTLLGIGYEPGKITHQETETPCGGHEVYCEFTRDDQTMLAMICNHCDRVFGLRFVEGDE